MLGRRIARKVTRDIGYPVGRLGWSLGGGLTGLMQYIGGNVGGSGPTNEITQVYTDAFAQLRAWENSSAGNQAWDWNTANQPFTSGGYSVALKSNGYPDSATSSSVYCYFITNDPTNTGTYALRFKSSSAPTVTGTFGCTISNAQHLGGYYTADVTLTSMQNNRCLRIQDYGSDFDELTLTRPGMSRTDTFSTYWSSYATKYGVHRYMDWMNTNGPLPKPTSSTSYKQMGNTDVTWSARRKMMYGAKCADWADVLAHTLATNKAPWINIPHGADDTYVSNVASIFSGSAEFMATGLPIYIEYTNEAWNSNFGYYSYNHKFNPVFTGTTYDSAWPVFKGTTDITSIVNTVDATKGNYFTITFTKAHNLQRGDWIMIARKNGTQTGSVMSQTGEAFVVDTSDVATTNRVITVRTSQSATVTPGTNTLIVKIDDSVAQQTALMAKRFRDGLGYQYVSYAVGSLSIPSATAITGDGATITVQVTPDVDMSGITDGVSKCLILGVNTGFNAVWKTITAHNEANGTISFAGTQTTGLTVGSQDAIIISNSGTPDPVFSWASTGIGGSQTGNKNIYPYCQRLKEVYNLFKTNFEAASTGSSSKLRPVYAWQTKGNVDFVRGLQWMKYQHENSNATFGEANLASWLYGIATAYYITPTTTTGWDTDAPVTEMAADVAAYGKMHASIYNAMARMFGVNHVEYEHGTDLFALTDPAAAAYTKHATGIAKFTTTADSKLAAGDYVCVTFSTGDLATVAYNTTSNFVFQVLSSPAPTATEFYCNVTDFTTGGNYVLNYMQTVGRKPAFQAMYGDSITQMINRGTKLVNLFTIRGDVDMAWAPLDDITNPNKYGKQLGINDALASTLSYASVDNETYGYIWFDDLIAGYQGVSRASVTASGTPYFGYGFNNTMTSDYTYAGISQGSHKGLVWQYAAATANSLVAPYGEVPVLIIVPSDGNYSIDFLIGYNTTNTKVSVSIDGTNVTPTPYALTVDSGVGSPLPTLQPTETRTVALTAGPHVVTLKTNADGLNAGKVYFAGIRVYPA